jgi:phosphohistidine phosphatase
MKTLYLVRHAKSSRDDFTVPDRQRPLETRGERDAAKMGRRLLQRHGKPDLIVSSPALRALATAKLLAEGLDYKLKRLVVDDRLYAAAMETLIAVIEEIDDKLESVMLVGHNPGFTDLAHCFSSDISHMPTCAVAVLAFDVKTWSAVGRGNPARVDFDAPKQSAG